jgi:predicted site-specific integrase-resolvase
MIFEGIELPRLLPLDKAARVLHVEGKVLDQWIREGRFQIVRIRGQQRILTSSIEDRLGQATTSLSNQEAQSFRA